MKFPNLEIYNENDQDMDFIRDVEFYEDCRTALIESYGEVDLAAEILVRRKYKDHSFLELSESVGSINEFLGNRIKNFISRGLGGGISKIDSALKRMRELEDNFITRENRLEKEYIEGFNQLVRLKNSNGDKESMRPINTKLQGIEKELIDSVHNYNISMKTLEDEVDAFVKKSNRKSRYYSLKRAKDSADSKKRRAALKYELSRFRDPEMEKMGKSLFNTTNTALAQSDEAEEELKAQRNAIISGTV